MKKCLIIGGGISGLTAASYLVSKKIKVTLLESSPKLGGRAYSFFDQETQTILDNGQHIMMGCFNETLDLLNLIEAKDNFIFQKSKNRIFKMKNLEILILRLINGFTRSIYFRHY